MKKITAFLLSLILLLSLFGCGRSSRLEDKLSSIRQEEIERQQEETQKSKSQEQQAEDQGANGAQPQKTDGALCGTLEGIFFREVENIDDLDMGELLEVKIFGEMVILEHILVLGDQQELYDTWAEEFWPDFPEQLTDGSASLEGKSQCYSIMSFAGSFQNMPAAKTLTLNGDTLTINDPDGNCIVYERREAESFHTDPAELLSCHGYASVQTAGPAGQWICQIDNITAWLDIKQDGSFCYAEKQPGKPSWVLKGGWTCEGEDAPLVIVFERAGCGHMPQECSLSWKVDKNGNLHMQNLPSRKQQSENNEVLFVPVSENWSINPENRIPFGYAVDFYSTGGDYRDNSGNVWTYSYRVPWILGDTPEIEKLNQKMNQDVVRQVEESLAEIDRQEQAELLSVDWESSVYENLLFVTLCVQKTKGFVSYMTFCYDMQEDRLISTPEILRQRGISEEEFVKAVREALELLYAQNLPYISDSTLQSPNYKSQKEWTMSEENINTDLMIYMDGMGKLVSITPVGSLEGSDWEYMLIYPDLKP